MATSIGCRLVSTQAAVKENPETRIPTEVTTTLLGTYIYTRRDQETRESVLFDDLVYTTCVYRESTRRGGKFTLTVSVSRHVGDPVPPGRKLSHAGSMERGSVYELSTPREAPHVAFLIRHSFNSFLVRASSSSSSRRCRSAAKPEMPSRVARFSRRGPPLTETISVIQHTLFTRGN